MKWRAPSLERLGLLPAGATDFYLFLFVFIIPSPSSLLMCLGEINGYVYHLFWDEEKLKMDGSITWKRFLFFLASAGHHDVTSGLVALQTKSGTSLCLCWESVSFSILLGLQTKNTAECRWTGGRRLTCMPRIVLLPVRFSTDAISHTVGQIEPQRRADACEPVSSTGFITSCMNRISF